MIIVNSGKKIIQIFYVVPSSWKKCIAFKISQVISNVNILTCNCFNTVFHLKNSCFIFKLNCTFKWKLHQIVYCFLFFVTIMYLLLCLKVKLFFRYEILKFLLLILFYSLYMYGWQYWVTWLTILRHMTATIMWSTVDMLFFIGLRSLWISWVSKGEPWI